MLGNPWPIPLLGLPNLTVRPPDADTMAATLKPFFALSSLETPGTTSQGFQCELAGFATGPVNVMALQGDAIDSRGTLTQDVNLVISLPPYRYERTIWVDGYEYPVRDRVFVLPACEHRFRTDGTEGVMLSLNAATLKRAAASMAGDASDHLQRRMDALLQRPHLLDLKAGHGHRHLASLFTTLSLIDRAERSGNGLSPQLALDDRLTRLVTLLLLPELDRHANDNSVKPLLPNPVNGATTGGERAMASLIDWIQADLSRPISLSDMEHHSGYARRTLQKAFHERFGMGPMQWLRRQRLAKAKLLIEQSDGLVKLGVIAQSCGYLNPSCFSRDFHSHYGVRASSLQRR
jgi:AraC-like DNA-binding protein